MRFRRTAVHVTTDYSNPANQPVFFLAQGRDASATIDSGLLRKGQSYPVTGLVQVPSEANSITVPAAVTTCSSCPLYKTLLLPAPQVVTPPLVTVGMTSVPLLSRVGSTLLPLPVAST
jgi:hypothetical protein